MLIDKINSSISAIENNRDAQARKKSIEIYKQALNKLNKNTKQLIQVLDTVDELYNSGITEKKPLSNQTVQDLMALIDKCGMGLHDGSLTPDTVQLLVAHIQTARINLNTHWETEASIYASGIKGYLTMIASLTDNPKEVRSLATAIEKAVNSNPTENSISKLVLDVGSANKIIKEYSLQPPIEAFLQKVSSNNATLADVTPTVREWLRDKKLMGKLRVTF